MANNIASLGQLQAAFLAHLERECQASRCAATTVRYYRSQLGKFVSSVGADRRVRSLVAFDLESRKTSWHLCQCVQRLFKWAVDMGLLKASPFSRVALPPRGQRERVLARVELMHLLRGARPAFRRFLIAMVHTLARPQEIRALRWDQLSADGRMFVLTEFKGRKRRSDKNAVRTICLDARLRRMIQRIRRSCNPASDGFVFLNGQGKPWSNNAVRWAMKRLRLKCGLVAGDGEEQVVCYTLRHTGATTATANGVRDRLLADLMGHSSTATTARYQHLQPGHLVDGIEQATRRPAG